MEFDDLSKQRIDYSTGPNGETVAVLTLTLQDGSIHRYTASLAPAELDAYTEALGAQEAAGLAVVAGLEPSEVAGLFGDIVKGVSKAAKSVANVAKKVVTSKVFKTAGKGLALAAPAMGPFAPAAMTVAAGMATASKLGDAAVAAEAGAKRAAKALTRQAKRGVAKIAKTPRARSFLLGAANAKRKRGTARASGKKGPSWGKVKRTVKRTRSKRKRQSKPRLLDALKAGKLRSNKPGTVTLSALRAADAKGRVFWVA